MSLTPASAVLYQCNVQRYRATATYADGRTEADVAATFSADPASLATIDAVTGELTVAHAWAGGAGTVGAMFHGVSATATFTVAHFPTRTSIVGITVLPSPLEETVGHSDTLSVAVYFSDNCAHVTANSALAWTSSDPAVATVSAGGVVTGVAPGLAMICGTVAGITACTTASVRP